LCPVRNLLALTVKWPHWLKPLCRLPEDVTSVSRLGIRKQLALACATDAVTVLCVENVRLQGKCYVPLLGRGLFVEN